MRLLLKFHAALATVLLLALMSTSCAPLAAFLSTPTETATATVPSPTFTPSATETPTPTFTPTPPDTPTPSETLTPSETPTETQTFTPTLTPSRTKIPSPTSTPIVPRVSITTRSQCRYGPGVGYEYKYGLLPDNWEDVIGRVRILSHKSDGSWVPVTWLLVQSMNRDPYSKCWVNANLTRVIRGDLNTVPDYFEKPKAPEIYGASHLYDPPANVSARRNGDSVVIFWQPIYMTEDDYVGYLIEAYICYKGNYEFAPIGYADSFQQNMNEADNQTELMVTVPDEPGCDRASHGQIFLAEKHGFSHGVIIPWPK
jgi:hypothetical protein